MKAKKKIKAEKTLASRVSWLEKQVCEQLCALRSLAARYEFERDFIMHSMPSVKISKRKTK